MTFNLADVFETVADAVADREALVCGDRRLTYAQLDEHANRVAHHLASSGIGSGDHVGLYLYNGVEYVAGMLACLKIRAVPINVNYRYVEEELRYLFDDADLVGVLHQAEFAPRIAAIADSVPKLRALVMVGDGDPAGLDTVRYDDAVAGASGARDFGERSPDDRFIIYTGGTTGMPKGVVWRQEDLFFTGMGGGNPLGQPVETPEQLAENAKNRYQLVQFPVPPLIHGAAQLGVFIGFNWGDKVVLIPRFDAELAWDVIEREKVNSMTIVGDAMARPLVEALEAKPRDTSSLVSLASAGAVLSPSVKEQIKRLLPNMLLIESFGATETGFQGVEPFDKPKPESGLRFQMNDRTTVLDENLRPVAPGSGVVGKLALRGRIPLGYYKDTEKTAQTFVEVDGARWVMQGDMATVDADGTIIVFGRGAVCINSGGEKIYPEEVEAAVKAHPAVYDAVIVGALDERWGERVCAIVQPRAGASITLDELDAHCRTRIAGYKVPRQLVVVDEVLRQPSGKPVYSWAKEIAAKAQADAR